MENSSSIVLIIALFIIMVGMGMSLTLADFKRVVKAPFAVFIGFLNQIVFLPLIAYGLATWMNVSPEIAMGIMILAACPGGPTSNLLTLLANGDKALSVTLTAVNSIITIFTIPFIVNFSLLEFLGDKTTISAPVGQLIGILVVVVGIPLIIGMVIKTYANNFAVRMEKPVRIASATVLALVIVGLIIKKRADIANYFEQAWMIALGLNVITMLVGFLSSKLAKLNQKQAICISLESGNQNGTMAITIAAGVLGREELAIAAAVYSLLMYVTAAIPVFIGNTKNTQETV